MISDERLDEIRQTLRRTSPAPWGWAYAQGEVETDSADLLQQGMATEPGPHRNIQLVANGQHRFWVELTDTKIAGDLVYDFDFIHGAREWVPELLAEVERLRGLLGRGNQ